MYRKGDYDYIVRARTHVQSLLSIQCGSGCACGEGAEIWIHLLVNRVPYVQFFTHSYAHAYGQAYAYADSVHMEVKSLVFRLFRYL